MKLFSEKEKSSFSYWFAHCLAFNMTAVVLKRWKPKYLFHDFEKPWLMLLWKDYPRVRDWHRKHNRHHLQYPNPDKIDWEAMMIDWECSRFTKESEPLNARQEYERKKNTLEKWKQLEIEAKLEKLGL